MVRLDRERQCFVGEALARGTIVEVEQVGGACLRACATAVDSDEAVTLRAERREVQALALVVVHHEQTGICRLLRQVGCVDQTAAKVASKQCAELRAVPRERVAADATAALAQRNE